MNVWKGAITVDQRSGLRRGQAPTPHPPALPARRESRTQAVPAIDQVIAHVAD